MGKNNFNDDSKIAIVINFDKTYKMIDVRDIKKYILRTTDKIEYILIPVLKYDNVNYFMINSYQYPMDIDYFEIRGNLALEAFEYGWSSDSNAMNIYEIISGIRLSTNNEIGIYDIYESLSMISYVNEIINPAFSDEFYLFSFDNPKFTIKKHSFECVNERINKKDGYKSYPSDNYGSISRSIDMLTNMVLSTINGTNNSQKLINTENSAITIRNGYCKFWEYSAITKSKMRLENDSAVGIFLPSVGTYTFLNSIQYFILSSIDSMQFQISFYEINTDTDELPCEYVTSDILNEYEELFTENFQMCNDILGVDFLVQLLSNFKCIANYIKVYSDVCFGKCIDDILFSIVGMVNTSVLPFTINKRCMSRYEFRYEITYSRIDTIEDVLSDYISKLIDELNYRGG